MNNTREIAEAMARAYKYYDTQGEAVEHIKNTFPTADVNVLWNMWYAIDAYASEA